MKMKTASKISSKYQVVIPKGIREKYNLRKYDVLVFGIEKDSIVIKKLDKLIDAQAGTMKTGKSFKELRKEFNKKMAEEADE